MAAPVFQFYKAEKRDDAFARLIQDREAQLIHRIEPEMLPIFDCKGENLIGMLGDGGPGGLESFWFNNLIVERGGPTARNHIALQSYHKIAMFWPKEILANLETPVMMLIPELDVISPPHLQQEMFDKLTPIKKVLWVKGKGHLNLLGGTGKDQILSEQVDFIREVLGTEIVASKL
ncbi:hypothetical protein Daus18300_002265 [Diaporthe australafricana]|uniref:Uncharacterized protein n=1 Tax=Diaporthe australafricana TaxID=127596 RepID=A0ABR3XQP2_9PEZI